MGTIRRGGEMPPRQPAEPALSEVEGPALLKAQPPLGAFF